MCEFINEGETKCGRNNKYGDYCTKHKRNHLIDNDLIIFNNFTNKPSDYLKNDIIKTLNIIDRKKYKKTLKKEILFTILSNKYAKFNYYENNRELIIKIQKYYRNKYEKLNILLRGPGFLDKILCNNQEDFFTYETVNEINDKYFFSYKDVSNIVWFFDIRSFIKLIELKQPNPYTMVPFHDNIINKCNNLKEYMKSKNIKLDFKDEMEGIKQDKKNILKQKMVDLSANIERLGYSFNMEWITCLGTNRLKKLYGILEDIWNYRAQLTSGMKIKICPPNGILFNKTPMDIRRINSRDTMRDIIVTDILKFSGAVEDCDKITGYTYFLMGLGSPQVNNIVCETHPWILYSI